MILFIYRGIQFAKILLSIVASMFTGDFGLWLRFGVRVIMMASQNELGSKNVCGTCIISTINV